MDSGHVRLAAADFDKISYRINTGNNKSANTSDLYFQPGKLVKNADGSQTISFELRSSDSSALRIVHQYVMKPDDYMLDFEVQLNGADKLLTQGIMNLTWNYTAAQQESDIDFEKQNTQMGYVEDGEFDYHTIGQSHQCRFFKDR